MKKPNQKRRIELTLEENIVDLQRAEEEIHLYNEYLIEIVKEPQGYSARIYKLRAAGYPCSDAETALKSALTFIRIRDGKGTCRIDDTSKRNPTPIPK